MIVHPELRALRSDDAPQRHAQQALHEAMAAWKAGPDMVALDRDLAQLAAGAEIVDCPMLARLFGGDGEDAMRLAAGFVAAASDALARSQLAHVPLRHFTDGRTSTLLLGRSGPVTLSLVALDGSEIARRPRPRNVSFGPNENWEVILAGQADAELVSASSSGPRSVTLSSTLCKLEPGRVSYRNGAEQAQLIHAIAGTLVSLRLQRRSANPAPTREYALADGALVHQAAGSPRASRIELMLALLGRMQCKDAAPQMAALATGSEASAALRWQALRECLALDTGAGFTALCTIAAAGNDPLAAPAGALRAQLIELHPQLLELISCPA